MPGTRTAILEVVSLRVICHACGASARIVNDDYGRRSLAGGSFFASHYDPELIAADVAVNGKVATYPIQSAA